MQIKFLKRIHLKFKQKEKNILQNREDQLHNFIFYWHIFYMYINVKHIHINKNVEEK